MSSLLVPVHCSHPAPGNGHPQYYGQQCSSQHWSEANDRSPTNLKQREKLNQDLREEIVCMKQHRLVLTSESGQSNTWWIVEWSGVRGQVLWQQLQLPHHFRENILLLLQRKYFASVSQKYLMVNGIAAAPVTYLHNVPHTIFICHSLIKLTPPKIEIPTMHHAFKFNCLPSWKHENLLSSASYFDPQLGLFPKYWWMCGGKLKRFQKSLRW